MKLVLSTDAKHRLKWTSELHQLFVEAVAQLGGADKATPKNLMRIMRVPGLTLYHLKSHLQKYRMGKVQHTETCIDNNKEDYTEIQSGDGTFSREITDGTQNQINESLQITQALQIQMEVQRKLHQKIEVQRHLQLRIEAQGKYLQSVLQKAKEALSVYDSSSMGAELTKTELSGLFLMISSGSPTASFSELTEIEGMNQKDVERKQVRSTVCSLESSLTSYESSGRKEENSRKRSETAISDDNCVDQPSALLSPTHKESRCTKLRKLGSLDMLDLNIQDKNDTT